MGFLLPFSVLGYAFVLHAAWRRQAELALLAAVSGMVVALYLAALGGLLHEGSWLVFLAGLACFLIALWGLWHDRQPDRPKVAEGFLSPGIVLFLGLSLLFRLCFADARLQLWDEFSHWGVMTREMLALGGLPGPVGAIIFKDYPPGANLLHFWAATIAGVSEGSFYQAHFMLLLAPALAFFSRLSWRQPGWLVLNLFMAAAITTTLSVFVCSLMVDVVLALYLAAGLYLASGAVIWRKRALLFLPILFCLPLIKNTGAFFAWMILSLILVNSLARAVSTWRADRRALGRPWREQLASYHPGRGRILALLLTTSLLVAAPLAAPATWKAHLAEHKIGQSFKTAQIGAPEMLATFGPHAPERSALVRDRFVAALGHQSLSNYVDEGRSFMAWIGLGGIVPGFSLAAWLVCAGLLILAGFLRHRDPADRARMLELWLIMAIFGALYLAGLVILYIFSFSEYEGPRLASFGRYVNTMLIPTLLLAWGWSLPFADESEEDQIQWGGWRRTVYLVCLGVFGLALTTQAPSPPGMPRWTALGDAHEDHAYVEPLAEVVRKVVPPDKKVFVVYQNTPGRPFHIIRYEIAPRPTNQWFFTLGEPYFEGDVWTENLSLADFAKMLVKEGFDFLFLARSDQQFWERYRPLFAPGTRPYRDIVFKVVPGGQHGVILVPAGARPPKRG
ncbi:MAG: hypothetical protein LDL07_04375 [Desulfarculus sp.]|nr:hypothetical protein [Desulfarculus sp.]